MLGQHKRHRPRQPQAFARQPVAVECGLGVAIERQIAPDLGNERIADFEAEAASLKAIIHCSPTFLLSWTDP